MKDIVMASGFDITTSSISERGAQLSDDVLDTVSGGGLITGAVDLVASGVKTGIHYAAKGVGMFMDADQVGGRSMHNFQDSVPALVDKIVDKII
jgi:hypothetical protein